MSPYTCCLCVYCQPCGACFAPPQARRWTHRPSASLGWCSAALSSTKRPTLTTSEQHAHPRCWLLALLVLLPPLWQPASRTPCCEARIVACSLLRVTRCLLLWPCRPGPFTLALEGGICAYTAPRPAVVAISSAGASVQRAALQTAPRLLMRAAACRPPRGPCTVTVSVTLSLYLLQAWSATRSSATTPRRASATSPSSSSTLAACSTGSTRPSAA